jgi:hypothetical protein
MSQHINLGSEIKIEYFVLIFSIVIINIIVSYAYFDAITEEAEL